jgi:tRNA(Ile2) C34 agmatinyltransferase TiaS
MDAIMQSFGKSPFRCRRCERRFYCPSAAKRAAGAQTPPADREA